MTEKGEQESLEKNIMNAIDTNDVHALKELLVDKDVNIFDENLMTPLQHACYKGNLDIVQLLLDLVNLLVSNC